MTSACGTPAFVILRRENIPGHAGHPFDRLRCEILVARRLEDRSSELVDFGIGLPGSGRQTVKDWRCNVSEPLEELQVVAPAFFYDGPEILRCDDPLRQAAHGQPSVRLLEMGRADVNWCSAEEARGSLARYADCLHQPALPEVAVDLKVLV